jgi:hypothetical protein
MRQELHATLTELVRSVAAPEGVGLTVTEAEIEIPLEVQMVVENGKMLFVGAVPHSRFKSGFMPTVHRCVVRVELEE